MSSENEKIEPKTDLELGTNDPSHCIWKTLNSDSGAGANASSRLDMKFVASDALSELVWSPDKGLSLKCADPSFADKNASLFWDVGPSRMVLASSQSAIRESSNVDEPVAAICVKANIDGIDRDTPTGHPARDSGVKPECKAYEEHESGFSGNIEEKNTADAVVNLHDDPKENIMSGSKNKICNEDIAGTALISQIKRNKSFTISGEVDKRSFDVLLPQADELKSSMDQNPLPRDDAAGDRDMGISNQAIEKNDNLCAQDGQVTEYKGASALGTNLTSSSRGPLEKLESTAENDLRNYDAACGASGALVSKSKEIDNKSQDVEMMLLCEKNLPILHSLSNSKIQMMSSKGKEKAASYGDLRLLKEEEEEDDSHESVESCNSAGLSSKGKRRWNFQQQLMVGSKRFKKQVQETSVPKYFVKQDSSFMNWISNMMKGFSQSIQDEPDPLPLTLEHTNHGHQLPYPKLITSSKNHDPEPKGIGFQSIFQAIYCPIGTRMSSANQQVRDTSEDFELHNKAHGIDATPITCCVENDNLYKQCMPSNESEQSAWRYKGGPSPQPKVEPANFVNSHESSKNDFVENKNCSNLLLSKEKEGMMSNSSSGRQNSNNTKNVDAYALPEKKEDNMCRKSDILRNLWITRFSPKSTSPWIISDHLDHSGRIQLHFSDHSKTPEDKLKIEGIKEAKESHNDSMNEKASIDAKNKLGNDDNKSIHNLIPVSSSPRVTNPEPIASVFARRLDAVKYIKPAYGTSSATRTNLTCLFCGTRGHRLHDCSEIAESELEGLLKKIISYGKLEEFPCLCIRCFQPNHWAISCPTSIPIGQHDLEVNALVNECSPGETKFNAGKETSGPLDGEEDHPLPGGTKNDGIDPESEPNLNLKQTSGEILTSKNLWSSVPVNNFLGSSSVEYKLKGSSMTSPCGFIGRLISDKAKIIFDAVRKLRLSRAEILKWMNSHMPISNLDGFFLRLRLGKWEEGLGGTGYYVASITEAQRQSSEQNTRKSISVIVGGIKCMVKSQYISNHDFLEEEIMAWWYTASKAGNNIPSEEDLMEKIKKKQILGF